MASEPRDAHAERIPDEDYPEFDSLMEAMEFESCDREGKLRWIEAIKKDKQRALEEARAASKRRYKEMCEYETARWEMIQAVRRDKAKAAKREPGVTHHTTVMKVGSKETIVNYAHKGEVGKHETITNYKHDGKVVNEKTITNYEHDGKVVNKQTITNYEHDGKVVNEKTIINYKHDGKVVNK